MYRFYFLYFINLNLMSKFIEFIIRININYILKAECNMNYFTDTNLISKLENQNYEK